MRAITSLRVGDSFESNHGTLYFVNLKFDDGTEGTAFSKAPRPPYGEGQMVEIEENGQFKNGTRKVKVKVPQDGAPAPRAGAPVGQGGAAPAVKSSYNSDGARVGMAVNNAVLLACHGIIGVKAIQKTAGRLIEIARELEAPGQMSLPPVSPVAVNRLTMPAPDEGPDQEELPANMKPVEQVAGPPPPQFPPASEVFEDDDIPF